MTTDSTRANAATPVEDGPGLDPPAAAHIDEIVLREMGPIGATLNRARREQEEWERRRHPEEGLRERKRRLTRHRISDVATMLFISRGFDTVRVSDVAELVGVSEKTIYNYFPTKEALVLDNEDEVIDGIARAFRERRPDESLTEVMIRAVKADCERYDHLPEEFVAMFPKFAELLASTPSLRSAWLDLHGRLVAVVRQELATSAEIDPEGPEPTIAARALVSLSEVSFGSRMRHITEGLRGDDLSTAVVHDVERAARLLETGLGSFTLLTRGSRTPEQLEAATRAAEEARAQVVCTLRQSREAWR